MPLPRRNMLCDSTARPVSAALCPRKALLITALPSPSASVPCHRRALPAVAAALPLRALRVPAEPLPIKPISGFANPSAANQSLCSSPHICAHANRLSAWPICAIASLFPSWQFHCHSLLGISVPMQIPANQRPAVAYQCRSSQFRCLSILRARSYPMPSRCLSDPICALANLGLQILCHSRLCNASATYCLSIPWRFRRYPILGAHCLSVARAKQGDALPLPFCSLLCRRNSAPCISFASRLIGATPCVAFARPSCSQPRQCQAMLFPRRSSLFFAVATPDTSLPLRRNAFLCPCCALRCESQLSPCTPPRINGNHRLSRALPG